MKHKLRNCLSLLISGVLVLIFFNPVESAYFMGLGDLPGGDFSSGATGISANGKFVVGSSSSSSGGEAFIWTAKDGMVGLGGLYGNDDHSYAEAISSDGTTVVGSGLTFPGCPCGQEAFRWTKDGGMVDLGCLMNTSEALGVSADGSIVVGASYDSGHNWAVLWTQSGSIINLGYIDYDYLNPWEYNLNARAVSGDGSIVVGTQQTMIDPVAIEEAFIWDSAVGIKSLQEVLTNTYGLDLTGWELRWVSAISVDGKTIVGWGINPDGFQEAWIANISPDGK